MEEVWKLVYIWILGFVIKFYDDLEDLFESKNERLVETVKTLMMVMTCYYLLILAETQYELYWVLYVVSLCLVDWHAYVGSSYFLSANIVVVIICIYVFITKGFTFNLSYFLLAFLLFSLCIPCVETLCCGINGPLHELCKFFGMAPDEPIFQFKTLSKTDLEVSFYKMKIRIASLIHLTLAWLIISFLRSRYNFSNNVNQILTAGMCICAVFHGYFLCSSMAQIYAVYFDNNRIINHHNAKNGCGIRNIVEDTTHILKDYAGVQTLPRFCEAAETKSPSELVVLGGRSPLCEGKAFAKQQMPSDQKNMTFMS